MRGTLALNLVICTTLVSAGCHPAHESSVNATLAQALSAHSAGNLAKAERLYTNVLLRDPKNKFAHYDLGLVYQTQKKDDAAELQYRAAMATDPSFVPALFNLAIVLSARGDSANAVELYKRVLKVDPKRAAAWLNLGLALRKLGRNQEADTDLAKAVALDSSLSARIPATPKPQGVVRPRR